MRLLQTHHFGRTWTETFASNSYTLRITLHISMLSFFEDFGLLLICSILFSAAQAVTTMPPIVPRSQVIMFSSFWETRNSLASHFELLNSAVIAESLSFSFFAKHTCVSASVSYIVCRSAICLQSAIPSLPFIFLVDYSANCLNKFHVRFVKFHACWFIALNSSSSVKPHYHATIHIAATYSRNFFIVCSFYFTSAFGFVFVITPLLPAIPATHS